MICDFCNNDDSNTIHVDIHQMFVDKNICPICLVTLDRSMIREGIDPGLYISEDKKHITNKTKNLFIPVEQIGDKNSYKFSLEEEPNYDYFFSTKDNKVMRLRFRRKITKKA